ncbi:hypothetical protein HWV62_21712 [Athelia sp. TMB]|nr:hypothetical protein HWV62_21712 [Athelia sp. TMB]
MTVLELVRLAIDHLGVGLIPVVLVGLILAFSVLCVEIRGRSQSLSMLLIIYWLLNITFQSIKVARLSKLEDLFPEHTKYPASDQLLDNAVILGLYIVFFIIEEVTSWKKPSAVDTSLATKEAEGVSAT